MAHIESGNADQKRLESKIDYPHLDPQPYHQSWREIELYGLVGWMSSWYREEDVEIATIFAGAFKRDPKTGTIGGFLSDCWGQSEIDGYFGEKLMFQKIYGNTIAAFEYTLNRGTGGDEMWTGTFRRIGEEDEKIGEVRAWPHKVHPNSFGMILDKFDRLTVDLALFRKRLAERDSKPVKIPF